MSLELETTESLYPFVLTEEQEQLRREIRDFAAREIAPNVMKWDEASEFPLDVVKKLGLTPAWKGLAASAVSACDAPSASRRRSARCSSSHCSASGSPLT